VALLLLASAACAPTSSLQTRYLADNAPRADGLLLVARMPDPAQRRQWERACIDALAVPGLRIVSSHMVMPGWYEAGNDALLAQARQSGLAAVLVAELSGLLLSPMQLPPRNQVSEERFSGPHESQPPRWQIWFGADTPEQPTPHRQTDVRLIAASGQTRWEGELTTHEANDLGAIANSQCRALLKTLQAHQLLP
jgi:hypothetical protein